MNQNQSGTSNGFPQAQNGFASSSQKNNPKPSRFSKSLMLLGSFFMLALQLFSVNANAVNIPVSAFSCTQTMTATSVCVGTGYYAAGWGSGTGYWQYTLNTVGYTGSITMTFSNTKSSAGGPTSGQVYYNIGGPDVLVSGGAFPVTTSCASQVITLPAACAGVANLVVKVKMLGATNNTATHRITSQNLFDGASATCSSAPTAGTVSAGTNPVCAGSSTLLTLTGASGGAGITYQWQSSPNNATWTNISGATALTYNTPALTATTYYRAVTTCSTFPPATTPSVAVTVNTVSIAAITGYTAPLLVGATQALSNATPGGLWLTSDPSVATISGSGSLTGVWGGNTVISYQVTDGVTGCVGSKTVSVNTVWPNTLALYAGTNGTSTSVIPVPGDHVGTLKAVGFGTAATCGSGGLSGLTVNVSNTTANEDSAHVGYKVYPDAGKVLNVFRIHARARISGTGPTKARIAYQYWSNGIPSGWVFEDADIALTTGSCGNSANSWDFNTGTPENPNPTINGITDSLEVAVYPFAPGASTGTFQLNMLEVYGIVTNNTPCNGGSIVTTADSALPKIVNICDSGSRFLNYNVGFGGISGVGIGYQWQVSTTSPTSGFANIVDANGVVYQTPVLNAGSSPSDTFYYRVKVTCGITGDSSFSASNIVTIHATPANAGVISGAIPSVGMPFDHILIGTNDTLLSTVAGGAWSSNDTSVLSINPTSGIAVPHIPGDAVITYRKAVGGCFGVSKDTILVYHPGTKALYVGRNGNSTNVYTASGVVSPVALTLTNWGSVTPCSNGGVSGLTNTTTVQDAATNGRAVINLKAVSTTFNAQTIRATLRESNSGTYMVYLGYNNGGGWVLSTPVAAEPDDCGYSHGEVVFTPSSSIPVNTAGVDFAVFGYNGTTTTPLQVNSFSVTGTGSALIKGTGVENIENNNANIQLYPNPATSELNVTATEKVNVAIFSIDGKKLLEQKDAKSINVSNLTSGMYLIQVYNVNNMLLKTEKFIKK